ALTAAGHREVSIEVHLVAAEAVARGDGADQRARIEHPVVVGEVVAGDEVESGVLLQPPVTGAQLRAGFQEVGLRDFAGPVAFGGAFQLAQGADGGEAEVMGDGHGSQNLLTGASCRALATLGRNGSCVRVTWPLVHAHGNTHDDRGADRKSRRLNASTARRPVHGGGRFGLWAPLAGFVPSRSAAL